MKQHGIDLNQVCLLDPKAEKELSPSDGEEFSWFLFGGILGDDPPRDRTSELRKLGFPNRHLGSVQMTTDTALVPLQDIPYVDHPTIRFNAKESVEMPFRYITDSKGDPILPEGMKALMKGRGLPGSHDPVLGADILERLSRINTGDDTSISLPVFDKSAYQGFGDRSSETVQVRAPVDVVILEGWCFGFQPLSLAELEKRYSGPEAEGGADKSSHRYFKSHSLKSLETINGNLKNYADLWYRRFTHFIQIVPENLYDVFGWRLQQEHAMKLKNGGRGMTDEEVHDFVARYMPGYELFQDTIELQSNPWIGHGLKVVLDKQRAVMRTEQF
ncbi:unnamed protein product [Rhizoctonia solani]|uniref:Uncharacterized protein n=1 Tax=Rhizoctonia solani TaxID=456999 RepID=A0A8H3GGL5_9AGAM|nr:unnamed protein product [Rhizoctonia solani]